MKLMNPRNLIIWAALAALFGFTVIHASWIAAKPVGKPKLIADRAAEPVRDAAGCIADANSGYLAVQTGPDVGALQMAAGLGGDGVRIKTERAGDALVLARQYKSTCAADNNRPRGTLNEAVAALTKPELFWQPANAADAQALIAALPVAKAGEADRNIFIGDDAVVAAVAKGRPAALAFTIASARACAASYKTSGMIGSVPDSCRNAVMLLSLGDLGYTLWGWPNRFLARMQAANTRVIIAESIGADGTIKGLTNVEQYNDIANSYNGYIWIDNITDLGPALKR
jgi:glycerophosphoryl diester phosphodiesterase